MARRQADPVHAEVIDGITVRPLRNGDASVVQAVFDALGPASRLLRFNGAKNALTRADLALLTRVDADHHVLVAWHGGTPVGIARLARDGECAEVAFAVADAWQGRGVGSVLAERLAADARAAGIRRLRADVKPGNVRSLSLLRRLQRAA